MATIKNLKKEIRYLCEQMIADSLEVAEMIDQKGKQKAMKVINEIAFFHNEMVDRANNPDGKDNPKLVKKHYQKLRKDFSAGYKKFYEKLYKLIPANQAKASEKDAGQESEE
ncbi:MAG: hypothetical protein JW798_17815 [Prolixibacteraceae bacterium]|nr:hypothetical protein [Prolixibacteraceae bacterium]